MRAEAEADQAVFDRLQEELRGATAIGDKMTRLHGERGAELEHYRQLVNGLLERWQAVLAQLDLRQRELDLLGRNMKTYRGSYEWLIRWLGEARQRQEKIQAVPIGDSKASKEQLAEEKVLRVGPPAGCIVYTDILRAFKKLFFVFFLVCSSMKKMHKEIMKTIFLQQRLLEEIERNMDNIENCEKNAKAYIDSVKVCFFSNV